MGLNSRISSGSILSREAVSDSVLFVTISFSESISVSLVAVAGVQSAESFSVVLEAVLFRSSDSCF